MFSQSLIQKGVVREEQLIDGSILCHTVFKKLNGFLVQRILKFVVKRWKRLRVDARIVIEAVKAQPLTKKLGRQTTGFRVFEHTAGLRSQLLRITQLALGRRPQQLRIRLGGPEKVTEPTRHFIVGQGDQRRLSGWTFDTV